MFLHHRKKRVRMSFKSARQLNEISLKIVTQFNYFVALLCVLKEKRRKQFEIYGKLFALIIEEY